jgi:hypothetical protein
MGWIGGELADVFKDDRKVVFMIALFIPLLSILGVSLVRLNPVPISKLNKHGGRRTIDKNNNHCHLNMANRIFTQIANQIIK